MIIVGGGVIFDLNKITSEILDSCVYNTHTRCWCSSPSCDTDTCNCSQFASHSFLITKSTGCKNKILFVLVQGDSRGMRLLPESRAPSKHCCASYKLEVGCLFFLSPTLRPYGLLTPYPLGILSLGAHLCQAWQPTGMRGS